MLPVGKLQGCGGGITSQRKRGIQDESASGGSHQLRRGTERVAESKTLVRVLLKLEVDSRVSCHGGRGKRGDDAAAAFP